MSTWSPLLVPGAFWLLCAASSLQLVLFHRRDGFGVLDYAVRGYLFYNPENFAPSGRRAWALCMIGALGFVLSLIPAALAR